MTRRLSLLLAVLLLAVGLVPAASAAPSGGPLPVPAPEENVDLPPGLTPYHEVAPILNDLARRSNRVKVEVTGQSAGGRDLYLATVSEPSDGGRFGQYQRFRKLMLDDPAGAQELLDSGADVKVPLFLNCSIHGNEWEGVDACLDQLERLAFSEEPEVTDLLAEYVVLVNVVQNPDGRVLGTRRNANGFDLNRDMITQSQPEARITRDLITTWNPMVLLDLHGYVGPGGLIEPCTPPHNPNYEYDLYIQDALAMAKDMRDRAAAATGVTADIPYLDYDQGWDDWPPIFVPMYAMYHGAYGHTLEAPFRVNGGAVDLPAAEREERAALNRAFHNASAEAMFDYAVANKDQMLANQLEIFERGAAAAQPVPLDPSFEGVDFLDTVPEVDYPQAYVIRNDGQDALAAADLVEHLLANDVEVGEARRDFTAGGESFARGDYVVDMAQPKRGLANTILELGYDISDLVDLMYDISGWSFSELWGAEVVRVEDGLSVATKDVTAARVDTGDVARGRVAAYGLSVETVDAVQAVTGLLTDGVDLWRTPDGVVHVPASEKSRVNQLASEGLSFSATRSLPADAEPLTSAVVGSDMLDDEEFVLRELGFELVEVTDAAVGDGSVSLEDLDVVATSDGDFDYRFLDDQAAFDAWVAEGGAVVGRGRTGAFFNDDAGLLDVDFDSASSRANGIVAVETDAGSPLLAPNAGEPTSFAYRPTWFTDLGGDVRADQRYGEGDVLLAGHWPSFGAQPEAAAGQASVVSGEVGEGRVAVFGTEPLFRAHPRELFVEFANALFWAASGD